MNCAGDGKVLFILQFLVRIRETGDFLADLLLDLGFCFFGGGVCNIFGVSATGSLPGSLLLGWWLLLG